METLYKVNFIWHGENIFRQEYFFTHEILKNLTEELFVIKRNRACDMLNGKYEDWNNEFHNLYPEKDGYSKEYLEYISKKQNEILKAMNEEMNDSLYELFSNETNCEICMRFKKYPKIWIEMMLIPYTE